MLKRNTVIDLWDALSDVPVIINGENVTVIDDPAGFMGWTCGTDVETIWRWFDAQFAQWGGVHALMYEHPAPERKFQVETPAGVIEVYSKLEGIDSDADFPGVYVDIRHTPEQLEGGEIGDMASCVEYDSCTPCLL